MKFVFCGNLDCPDWILAEIATLSQLSFVRLKLLAANIIKEMLGTPLNYEKVERLVGDADFAVSDTRAVIAAIQFIVGSAAKYNCDMVTLKEELAQLGLPAESCRAIGRAYRDVKDALRMKFAQDTLSLPPLESLDWRVDYLISSSKLTEGLSTPTVQMEIGLGSNRRGMKPKVVSFELTADKFRALHSELKTARALMDNM